MNPYEQCEICGALTHDKEGAYQHYRWTHSPVAEAIKTHDLVSTDLMRCHACGKIMPALPLFEHFLALHASPVLKLTPKGSKT